MWQAKAQGLDFTSKVRFEWVFCILNSGSSTFARKTGDNTNLVGKGACLNVIL